MTKQERAARTRRALILSAAEVFDQEGFAPASLTMISSRAGVSNGALHFHFANKNAVAEAVQGEALSVLRQIAHAWPEGATPSLQSLVDTSHTLAQRLQDDVVLRAGFGLSGDTTWKERADLRRHWVDWVSSGLTVVALDGALADDVATGDALAVIAATTLGFEAMGRTDPQWSTREMFTRLWRLLLPRISADNGTGPVAPEGTSAPGGVVPGPRWWPERQDAPH
ncbi:ScbR family autoregulator-binding transcription factor [Streptomyces violaceoruber]|uniref:Regulatory protein n=1 Tax=Streptomyces coelicolor (strain ATCC BAA-471 / A3(2) / M145) TaxID=100226 RepID=Q93S03_STRCO|nr:MULTISPECIES: ScbR family autoregulator-binding transcription factor [Streptomyces]MDX2929885.1 ScbR family autoregulator-binding transcription factor [Streptomyces sp. NRRL_B-16638]MDX3350360.1 ScbR family autoregulator-binding transcription factor [Streptomyces sp. ME02-6979A]MDX3366724.1 ScbR family autoregulator-binding transcription factor [Streptomyces sp. ME02-6987-2C]MDX3398577.1 ScbR family autoregulator-binding transcription factor [Streptomyces sp. ME01-18h]MDX3404732.1 ScbR fami